MNSQQTETTVLITYSYLSTHALLHEFRPDCHLQVHPLESETALAMLLANPSMLWLTEHMQHWSELCGWAREGQQVTTVVWTLWPVSQATAQPKNLPLTEK